MHGHESEILTTTFLMLSAVSFGLFLRWLKQPPLVGYILAGVALGPAGLGLVDYLDEISSLAEFDQICCCILLALLVSAYFNWTLPQILLIGFILTLSSTAVALMVLQGLGQSRTHAGQLTVGVLVAQDIAVVPMLVFAQSGIDVLQQWQRCWKAMSSWQFCLALAFFLAASLTGYIGLSPVFGAFCAGLPLAHTNLCKAVLDVIQPVQSLLLVVFFVSIGLLIDLEYVKSHWGVIVGVTFGVLFIKTLMEWDALLSGDSLSDS